ncbi:hypothetical protein ASG19_07240 [Rhizobium sp. Leaf306]|nr:hypothetical protein ASG19_07240 [Rhizobium sp. Leaf306]
MPELIPDEIETLRMLAGQELASLGLCSSVEPHRLTDSGILCLDLITGTIDIRSRRVAWPSRGADLAATLVI